MGTFISPLLAMMIAAVAFNQPGVASADGSLQGFWSWISKGRSSWDPAGTLALLVGVVLPLFLATQLGAVAAQSNDDEANAQVIGLEILSNVACWLGSIVGWLVLPSAVAAGGNIVVNAITAACVPMLFTWLLAVSRASPESRRLASQRTRVRCIALLHLIGEFEDLLKLPDGRTPGRGGSIRPLWVSTALEGLVCGAVLGAALAVHRLFGMDSSSRPKMLSDIAVMTLAFAFAYLVAVRELVEYQAKRLVDGLWSALMESIPVASVLLVMSLSGVSLLLVRGWRPALAIWAISVGSVVLARLREKTRVRQALVYRRVRSHGRSTVRSCRTVEPQVHFTDLWESRHQPTPAERS